MMPNCNALKNHLCVSVDGHFKPCCRYISSEKFSVNDYTFEEYRNTEFYKTLVSNMKKGWDKGCGECKLEEEVLGKESMRHRFNRSFNSENIEFVELSVSNQCNISCRMCNEKFSSKWAEIKQVEVPKQNFSKLIEKINWKHVKIVKYLGGEPFITKEFKMLLDFLPDDVTLHVNTNCTLFPNKYIERLKKFKHVMIALSIDGVGKVDEYIRQGTDWNKKVEVIDQWLEFSKETNSKVFIHTVVQAHNIHDIKNIKQFAKSKNLENSWSPAIINYPDEYRLEALDEDYVNQIKDEDNAVFLNTISNYNTDLNEKFKSTTQRMDALFGTRWEDLIK